MKRSMIGGLLLVALSAASVCAQDINFKQGLSQGQFKDFSKEFGSLVGYRNLVPAEPLKMPGFDLAAEASTMSIDNNTAYWRSAFGGANGPDYLSFGRIRARVGLPFGIDVGAMYAEAIDSNGSIYGAELSKSIIDIGPLALSARGTYTKLDKIDDLDMQTLGADATLSAKLLIFTPYAGGGMLWIDSKPKGQLKVLSPTLSDEQVEVPRGFVGLKVTIFPFLSLSGEAEYAERAIYSARAAFTF